MTHGTGTHGARHPARRPTAAPRQHRRDDASVLTRSCLLRSSPPCLLSWSSSVPVLLPTLLL
uniref:Uncharacterized protein n=1 Tax=Fagus sylvatica TaxID=28930 RepID=A0A2N9GVS6_FAGSY